MPRPRKQTVLLIRGMRDSLCRDKVVSALTAVVGVSHVDVSLYRSVASVLHDPRCTLTEFSRAVARVGCAAAANSQADQVRSLKEARRWAEVLLV